MSRRPRVVIAKAFSDDLVAALLPDCDVVQGPDDQEWPRADLLPRLAEADALISWAFNRFDGELLAAAPRLQIVSLLAIGTDCLDREALAARSVWATNVPGFFAPAAAEVTIGLIIAVMRRLVEAASFVAAGEWDRPVPGRFDGPCLEGKRLGLIGLGNIGGRVARVANALGMEVVYHDQQQLDTDQEAAWRVGYALLDELLASSDVVSCHVPLTAETFHLLDQAAFARMKPGAYLINTSRGPVVDEQALIQALDSGQLAGAGLDVLEHEPAVPAGLRQRPNVVILPHMAGGSREARRAAMTVCLEEVARVLAGQEPRNVVVRPVPRPAD